MLRRAVLVAPLALPFGGASAWPTRMWPIGVARMQADGTIVLDPEPQANGETGRATFLHPPQPPDDAFILRHIGGIAVGQVRAVPPF